MSISVNMEQHVVLEGLPTNVGATSKEKFRGVLESTITKVVGHNNYIMRLIDGADGFVAAAFIDFKNVAQADTAVSKLHKYVFTKTSTLNAYRWSDFGRYLDTPATYHPPAAAASGEEDDEEGGAALDMTNTFMLDPKARPQLLVKGGDAYDVNLSWFNTTRGSLDLLRGVKQGDEVCRTWSEMDRRAKKLQPGLPTPMPQWTPLGTYLMTQHPTGIRFWGGKSLGEVAHIQLNEVTKIYVSPNETYFVAFGAEQFQFWHIAESRLIRELKMDAPEWPAFKYNANDGLAGVVSKARSGTSFINIHQASTMKRLIDVANPESRYTISVDGLTGFEWNPTQPDIFAYVIAGDDSQGFRVLIERVEYDGESDNLTLTTILRRNVFQCTGIDLLWHPEGHILATKITTSRGTTEYTICRLGASSVSAEKLELKPIEGKQTEPLRFAFQPNGNRFAVIQQQRGSAEENLKKWVVFYSVDKIGFKEVGTYKTEGHRLHWAPKGMRCVVSNFERSVVEFFGVQGAFQTTAPNPTFTLIAAGTHHMVTNVAWDPTGRYFCTFTSSLEQQMDNVFRIWNVNGQMVVSEKVPKLSHCVWRPLAKSLLSPEDVARLRKELPKTSERYLNEALSAQREVEARTAKRKADAEARYKKIMDSIREHATLKEWTETRDEQIASSPAFKQQAKFLKEQPPVPIAAASA